MRVGAESVEVNMCTCQCVFDILMFCVISRKGTATSEALWSKHNRNMQDTISARRAHLGIPFGHLATNMGCSASRIGVR